MVSDHRHLFGFERKYCTWGRAKGKAISKKQQALPLCTECIGSQVNRELWMFKKVKELKFNNLMSEKFT